MDNKILAKKLKEVIEKYQAMGYFTFKIEPTLREEAVYYSIASELFKSMTVREFIQFFNID